MIGKLDLNDSAFLRDRRASYRRLRETNPVAQTELNGEQAIVLTRHRDIDALLKDKRAVMQPAAGEYPAHIGKGPAATFYRLSLPSMDAPQHTRIRRIVSPALAPQAVARMEEWVREIIDRRIEEVRAGPVFDVVEQLGDVIPVDVACRLLHVPREDADLLVSRVNDLNAVLSQADVTAEQMARADDAAQTYFDYFAKLIARNRGLEEQDIVGALSKAQREGGIDHEELATTLIDVFLGSYHTSMVSFANAIRALALFPAQRAALAADPALATRAWEEVLRFDSPVHFRHRYVSEPIVLDGHEIQPRVKIMMGLAAANWDETAFAKAEEFNLARPAGRHMTFGGGGHFCLGSQLARLEGRIFLPRFLQRFPEFKLAEQDPPRFANLTFPFLERLPIEVGGH